MGNQHKADCRDIRKKVERAKQLIKNQIESNDPDTVKFINELFERFPEINSMKQKAWEDRWEVVATQNITKFVMTVIDKIVRELAEKL